MENIYFILMENLKFFTWKKFFFSSMENFKIFFMEKNIYTLTYK